LTFFNVNTQEDLKKAEQILRKEKAIQSQMKTHF